MNIFCLFFKENSTNWIILIAVSNRSLLKMETPPLEERFWALLYVLFIGT